MKKTRVNSPTTDTKPCPVCGARHKHPINVEPMTLRKFRVCNLISTKKGTVARMDLVDVINKRPTVPFYPKGIKRRQRLRAKRNAQVVL